MQFKYSYNDDSFSCINVRKNQRGRPLTGGNALKIKYTSKLPISKAKKNDLLSLCKSGFIPNEDHKYYEDLPTSGKVKDKLPEPDIDEELEDTDTEN